MKRGRYDDIDSDELSLGDLVFEEDEELDLNYDYDYDFGLDLAPVPVPAPAPANVPQFVWATLLPEHQNKIMRYMVTEEADRAQAFLATSQEWADAVLVMLAHDANALLNDQNAELAAWVPQTSMRPRLYFAELRALLKHMGVHPRFFFTVILGQGRRQPSPTLTELEHARVLQHLEDIRPPIPEVDPNATEPPPPPPPLPYVAPDLSHWEACLLIFREQFPEKDLYKRDAAKHATDFYNWVTNLDAHGAIGPGTQISEQRRVYACECEIAEDAGTLFTSLIKLLRTYPAMDALLTVDRVHILSQYAGDLLVRFFMPHLDNNNTNNNQLPVHPAQRELLDRMGRAALPSREFVPTIQVWARLLRAMVRDTHRYPRLSRAEHQSFLALLDGLVQLVPPPLPLGQAPAPAARIMDLLPSWESLWAAFIRTSPPPGPDEAWRNGLAAVAWLEFAAAFDAPPAVYERCARDLLTATRDRPDLWSPLWEVLLWIHLPPELARRTLQASPRAFWQHGERAHASHIALLVARLVHRDPGLARGLWLWTCAGDGAPLFNPRDRTFFTALLYNSGLDGLLALETVGLVVPADERLSVQAQYRPYGSSGTRPSFPFARRAFTEREQQEWILRLLLEERLLWPADVNDLLPYVRLNGTLANLDPRADETQYVPLLHSFFWRLLRRGTRASAARIEHILAATATAAQAGNHARFGELVPAIQWAQASPAEPLPPFEPL